MSGATPQQTAADVAAEYATLLFIIEQVISGKATAAMVKVQACTNSGGLSPWGTVDVVPLVNQVAGDGTNVPHGTVYKLPYHRIQGGINAVIIDPVKDDIGLAVFTMRDSSAVKTSPAQAVANANAGKGTPPGSARTYSMADGMYFGGFLNAVPVQYIRFGSDGITITSPTKVTINAPQIALNGAVTQTGGAVDIQDNVTVEGTVATTGDVSVGGGLSVAGTTTGTGAATFTGNVTAAGVPLKGHNHGPGTYTAGATAVTGNSSPT